MTTLNDLLNQRKNLYTFIGQAKTDEEREVFKKKLAEIATQIETIEYEKSNKSIHDIS